MNSAKGDTSSPKRIARIIGLLWLACILTSIAGVAVSGPVIVRGDPASTAANIVSLNVQYRLGIVANLLSGLVYLGLTGLLYWMLKPVSRPVAFTAACFGVVGVAVSAVWTLAALAATNLLQGNYSAFEPAQLQQAAMLALKVADQIFILGMVFFGVQMAVAGSLIARSKFLPRALGLMLAAGGTCYVVYSLLNVVAPSLGSRLFPAIMLIALLGEGSLTVWLLIRGVDERGWHDRADVGLQPEGISVHA